MITCTFLGHSQIYDKDLYHNLRITITKIVTKYKYIEFIFNDYNCFDTICENIINEVKSSFQDKYIILTKIDDPPNKRERNKYSINQFDKYISPLDKFKISDFSIYYRQVCWAIEHSNILISYTYNMLDKDLTKCINFANNSSIEIIELTTCDTYMLIHEQRAKLCEKERLIIGKREEGITLKQIGLETHVTIERVRQQEIRAYRRIREMLFDITNN